MFDKAAQVKETFTSITNTIFNPLVEYPTAFTYGRSSHRARVKKSPVIVRATQLHTTLPLAFITIGGKVGLNYHSTLKPHANGLNIVGPELH